MRATCCLLATYVAGLAFLPSARVASAQCPGDWRPGEGIAGTFLPVRAMTVWDSGNTHLLCVGGDFVQAGDLVSPYIAAWDGTSWRAIGSGIDGRNSRVRALGVHNGDLIVGGKFPAVAGLGVNNIASWDGTNWHPLGSGVTASSGDSDVYALTEYNGDLVAGGAFTNAGGQIARGIARWNGTTWASLGTGVSGYVLSLRSYNGDLIVGGNFSSAGNTSTFYLARWNGATWQSLGTGPFHYDVLSLMEYQGSLFAGGSFLLTCPQIMYHPL